MYCVTFTEGQEQHHFYYHDYRRAVDLIRTLLIVEINKIIKEEIGEDPLDELDQYETSHLQRLLNILIKLNYRDEEIEHRITIDVAELYIEDDV